MANLNKNYAFPNYSIVEMLEFSTGISTLLQFFDFQAENILADDLYYVSRMLALQIDINAELACRLPSEILEHKEGDNDVR
jgi:hypothetical protein